MTFRAIKTLHIRSLPLLIAITMVSCEDIIYGEGKIYDAQTHEPLDSVLCKNSKNETYSDSTGSYDLGYGWVKCTFGCQEVEYSFSKPGYRTLTMDNPYKQNIFLRRQ